MRSNSINNFTMNEQGNTAIFMALFLGALTLLVSGMMEFAFVNNQKQELQSLADISALAAASEIAITSNDPAKIEAVATAYVASQDRDQNITVNPDVDLQANTVGVNLSAPLKQVTPFRLIKAETITASATAIASGESGNICVIGLNETVEKTVSLESNASLYAPNCAIYSNSKHSYGLVSLSNAKITAEDLFTSGGYQGMRQNFAPLPITDAPTISNPLANRPHPTYSGCDFNNYQIGNKTITIHPGVYCGGLSINSSAKVTLSKGIYILKDGPLKVEANAELTGEGVGFFLTGRDAYFIFTSNAKVTLSAPEDGVMAGLLFFEDKYNAFGAIHRITSEFTRYLVGTIYLPRGRLSIDAVTPVADHSEFTVIVANTISLTSSPNLVLNTDYASTPVPVPQGVVAQISG
ncbi:TadE/TadG family type IV pilus assembly protein [Hirschia litorea]|uniref:TadE/TadG family type IV pilus assembly protein n=1 Tax=Hirschia litorea TaxID=1199156 RepID=A0ABW2IPZ0_9PROT